MSEAKTGMFIYPFFWFMNRLISTSQQIKSVVRWFFPILQFNCGRDVSSQYFISTKMQDCPHFWPPYLSSERSSGNKKSPTLLLTKDISLQIYSTVKDSQLTCNSTTAKANLVSCSFAGWSAALMNREILKKCISSNVLKFSFAIIMSHHECMWACSYKS